MDENARSQRQKARECIKDLLVLQYALHEVVHFARLEGTTPANGFLAPRAHTVSDIYKCLHQGIFGVGHSIRHPRDFKRRLVNELERARTSNSEPLLENVSPVGSVFRVNLRPFRALFLGNEEKGCEILLQVCLESASMETGSAAEFFAALELFRDLNRSGGLEVEGRIFSFPEQTVDSFLREIRKLVVSSGFVPVLSHSPVYRSFNDPSYRVVHLKAFMRSPLSLFIEAPPKVESGYVH